MDMINMENSADIYKNGELNSNPIDSPIKIKVGLKTFNIRPNSGCLVLPDLNGSIIYRINDALDSLDKSLADNPFCSPNIRLTETYAATSVISESTRPHRKFKQGVTYQTRCNPRVFTWYICTIDCIVRTLSFDLDYEITHNLCAIVYDKYDVINSKFNPLEYKPLTLSYINCEVLDIYILYEISDNPFDYHLASERRINTANIDCLCYKCGCLLYGKYYTCQNNDKNYCRTCNTSCRYPLTVKYNNQNTIANAIHWYRQTTNNYTETDIMLDHLTHHQVIQLISERDGSITVTDDIQDASYGIIAVVTDNYIGVNKIIEFTTLVYKRFPEWTGKKIYKIIT